MVRDRQIRRGAVALTLFPAIDIRDGRAVRPARGSVGNESAHDADPVATACAFAADGAEWLHVVDLDAAFGDQPRNRHLVADIGRATGLPVQASGGIRTRDDLDAAIRFGASRVVIGTMALNDPSFVAAALDPHGDKVAVGLDAEGTVLKARGKTSGSGDLFHALATFTALGVVRFVFTDVSRDGMLTGPDLEQLRQVAEATTAAITASGGVSCLDDLRALATVHDRVDAAVIGKALYADRFTLPEALAAAR